ncbi:MAG TPA: cation:proton antiporter [Candidatus Methylomirabilis sp.]|nr:cation:proton antiporter [Candidatus Methylomirabilis sp.]
MPHDASLLRDIALSIVFAAIAAHVARLIRQPLILGYIAGGILLGPRMGLGLVRSAESSELISEIGLIFLLFIIGLEIDLRELRRMGRSLLALGVGQFVINALLGLVFFSWLGYHAGGGSFDLYYLAVVISLSSTLIVVKLLRDKFELKVLSGRLTLGALVVQDLWAILFMAVQPNLAHPDVFAIARSIAGGAVLVVLAFLVSRHVLARLFEASSRWPELVLISSAAWCFVVSGVAERLGLSKEMGALIAGVSISTFPYGSDVISKITGVRDFFVTLFFVALGMKAPLPTETILRHSALIGAFVVVSRFIAVVPIAYLVRGSLYAGTVTALNLAQISEFSLVILTLGIGYGHVSADVAAVMLTAMILTSLVSPYVIGANDRIARLLLRPFERAVPSSAPVGEVETEVGAARDIMLLGHFRIAQAVLDQVERQTPLLKGRITLVDYDATRGRDVIARGFHWEYGDLAHPDALEHLGIEHARIIVTTISDTFLKGITTRRLAANLRRLAPRAVIVMTGEEKVDADELLRAGADHVLVPGEITGERIVEFLVTERQGPES